MLQKTALDANLRIIEFLPIIQLGVGNLIRVELRLDPTLPLCRADATQLEGALLNVAINARDAMEGSGTLTIATRCAALDHDQLADNSEAEPGDFIAVSLTDTGHGMSQEVVDRAFEPFFTTKDIGAGTGLGLSQVLGFVRQLSGHVTIESTSGSGTVVTLFLPRA
jgi:signal transduction histidine kinase